MENPVELQGLLSHATWLRRLADHLARGTSEAGGDLVQETWVAALRSPPALDRPARPWLAEVLRNSFRKRLRARQRLQRREADVSRVEEDSPSPEQLLERAEAQRLLGDLVLGLDEPYRTTVLLRYFEDLPPVEIARLTGAPPGTVRWRLSEALQRLRAALAASDRRGSGAGVLGALAPLLPRPAPALGSTMKGVTMAAVVTGKTKIGVAAVAALALAVGLGVRARLNARAPVPAASAIAPVAGTPAATTAGRGGTTTTAGHAPGLPRLQPAGAPAAPAIIYGDDHDVTFEELAPQFRAVLSQIAMGRRIDNLDERRDLVRGRIRTRVTFHVDGVRHEVMMDEQGKLVASEVAFKPSELPAVVLNGIKAAYPEAVIVKADRQWRDDRPIYFDVDMTVDGRALELHLSEDGEVTQTKWK